MILKGHLSGRRNFESQFSMQFLVRDKGKVQLQCSCLWKEGLLSSLHSECKWVTSMTCCRRSCCLSSCCDRFPDAVAAAVNEDDNTIFLTRMLVFCSKIWFSRFIVCSVLAVFSGASSVSFCQSVRGFHDLPKKKPSFPFMLPWSFISVATQTVH